MPSGSVMPYPRIQFLDTSGAPLASGTLETYEAGTTTALATYSDVTLSTANPTTITLNSAGRPSVSGTEVAVFLAARAYKFILRNSAGTIIWTQDNVYALQPATSVNLEIDGTAGVALDANDLCYLSDGSGGLTAGRWYKADADLSYGSTTARLAFATAAIASGGTGTLRRGGTMTGLSGLVAGSRYYVSAVAGALTVTAPTNARLVGTAASSSVLVMEAESAHAAILEQKITVNASTPYALTWPAADAAGVFSSNGAGVTTLGAVPVASAPPQVIQTTTSTGTVNNFAQTAARRLLLRCNNASLLTITGFAAGTDGDTIDIVAINAQVDLAHASGGSSAGNKLTNWATSGNTSLAAATGTARYVYDATSAVWRLVSHEQGAWITPAFAAGNFTHSAGTWTVESGDVSVYAYRLSGRTLSVAFTLDTTSVSGTAGNKLWIAVPGGFTATASYYNPIFISDNGVIALGYAFTGAATISCSKIDGSNYAGATNTTYVRGEIAVPVS